VNLGKALAEAEWLAMFQCVRAHEGTDSDKKKNGVCKERKRMEYNGGHKTKVHWCVTKQQGTF
jgi:hypothetical protein